MKENILIKIYFYINNGVTILNNFRNLGLGIFALYFAMKLANPLWLIVMGLIALPILAVVGYYNVHRISKISEQLSVKHGTHYGIQQFELQQKQVELLEKIYEQQHNKKVPRRTTKKRLP